MTTQAKVTPRLNHPGTRTSAVGNNSSRTAGSVYSAVATDGERKGIIYLHFIITGTRANEISLCCLAWRRGPPGGPPAGGPGQFACKFNDF